MASPILPIVALVAIAFAAKKKKPAAGGGGAAPAPSGGTFPGEPPGGFPGGVTDTGGLPPPPPELHGAVPGSLDEIPAVMPLRTGVLAGGVATYYGGSLGELIAENPGLDTHWWTVKGKILTRPILPGKWRPWSKPLPGPGSNPVATDLYPEPLPR